MKGLWSILNKSIGKLNDKSNFPESFLINNQSTSNKYHIASAFNNYFSSIGELTGDKVPKSNNNYTLTQLLIAYSLTRFMTMLYST